MIISSLNRVVNQLVELVFPSSCVSCGREGALLCHICLAESSLVADTACRICAEPMTASGTCSKCRVEPKYIDRLYGYYQYDSPVGEAIRAFKFDDIRALEPVFSELLDVERLKRVAPDLVLPVPLSRSRIKQRGFNQSEVFSRHIAALLGINHEPRLLSRTEQKIPQSQQQSARSRAASVSGAFTVNEQYVDEIATKRILVVDDVHTTGSTINECARVLKSVDASWVGAVTLAVQPVGVMTE